MSEIDYYGVVSVNKSRFLLMLPVYDYNIIASYNSIRGLKHIYNIKLGILIYYRLDSKTFRCVNTYSYTQIQASRLL